MILEKGLVYSCCVRFWCCLVPRRLFFSEGQARAQGTKGRGLLASFSLAVASASRPPFSLTWPIEASEGEADLGVIRVRGTCTAYKMVAFSKWLGLGETNHRFLLGNEYPDRRFFFSMLRSPFYTVNVDQFLLQSEK